MKTAVPLLAEPRRFATPFEPVTFPLSWRRMHVEGLDVVPSEVFCTVCKKLMLPIGKNGDHVDALFVTFPLRGPPTGNVPGDTPSKGCSPWICLGCERGVVVTR